MMFSMKDQELSLFGAPRPRLEVGADVSEVELERDCARFGRTIDELCGHHVEYARRIDDLSLNYSRSDLERARAFASTDVFAAKHDLLRACAKGPDADPAEIETCRRNLNEALIQQTLLDRALTRPDPDGQRENDHARN